MKVYQTKVSKLAGTDYREVYDKAKAIFLQIKKKSKRRSYIRSAYFNKEKIFLDLFWQHIHEKNWWDQTRRLKFYSCALDLIQNSKFDPLTVQNPNRARDALHRFFGKTKQEEEFIVQITENKRNKQKYFISVFPK